MMQSSRLATHLTSNDLFKNLDVSALSLLEADLELVQLTEGEILFRQGDPGDSMYVLFRGGLVVRMHNSRGEEMVIGEEVEAGTSVGEMSLVTRQTRFATLYALTDVELVKFSKAGFDRLVENYPQILVDLAKITGPRWKRVQLARALMDLIGGLETAALNELQDALEWHTMTHGEVLFKQGDPGDATYIIINGRLRITAKLPDGSERVVDELGPGDIVGEFAMLTGEVRSATVSAIRETNLVKLTPLVFNNLLERYPQVMMKITRIIIKRLKKAARITPTQRTRATNLALVPISQDAELTEFVAQLAESLASFGRVLHISSTRFDQLYGKEGAAQTSFNDPIEPIIDSWLSEQETKHTFILYEADPSWSTWTRRCLRQADRLIIVGQADNDPAPGAIEAAIQSMGVGTRIELVLLHPPNTTRPSGTSEWLRLRNVDAHHHIRRNDKAHYQRFVRGLTGQTIGLVLSGGGARGFAHLGAFRAFDELGILIDYIGGTSMGSLLGAGYAMGRDYEDMVDLARQFASPKILFDYTLPFVSLMASKKVTRVLKDLFEDLCIEDLWIPYFCVSANLSRAEPMVHRSDKLWKGARASMSIPGVFSPVLHEDDILVDGGVMNNFPVDIMDEICGGGTIIGVNVGQTHEPAETDAFDASISGWQVLWSRINPFTKPKRIPSIGSTLIRSMEISSAYQLKMGESLADVLIEPDVMQFGTLDFAAYREIIELGYQAALEKLVQFENLKGSSV